MSVRRSGCMRTAVAVALLGSGLATGQSVTVPKGELLVIRTKAPIDGQRPGQRFAGVLVEDVVVDFMGVAAAGEVCAGMVVAGPRGTRTLIVTEVHTRFGPQRVAAGAPQFGEDPSPSANVVGFGGSLAKPAEPAPSLAGQTVEFNAERTSLPAGTTLEFEFTEAWERPLRETVSVFPQPEGAEVGAQRTVPAGWFEQVDQSAAQRRQQDQRAAQQAASARQRRAYYKRSRWRNSRMGAPWPVPNVSSVQPLSAAQYQALRGPPATLPVGTAVVTRTSAAIDSSKIEPGAPFDAILMTDIVDDGRIIFGRGSPAKGAIVSGQLGEVMVPTPTLTSVQRGRSPVAIRTGPSQILHRPARANSVHAIGPGAIAGEPEPPWASDGTLRLPAGTIIEFSLAQAVTVR